MTYLLTKIYIYLQAALPHLSQNIASEQPVLPQQSETKILSNRKALWVIVTTETYRVQDYTKTVPGI